MALFQLPPPDPMKCSGDLAQNWKIFREAFTDYAMAMQLTDKSNKVQVATLKTVIGTECKQVLKRLELTQEELSTTLTILEKLELHFAPEWNILYERYLFHSAEQQPNKNMSSDCANWQSLASLKRYTMICSEIDWCWVRETKQLGRVCLEKKSVH